MEKMEARVFGGPQRKTRPETQKWCVQISVGDVVMIKRKRTNKNLEDTTSTAIPIGILLYLRYCNNKRG